MQVIQPQQGSYQNPGAAIGGVGGQALGMWMKQKWLQKIQEDERKRAQARQIVETLKQYPERHKEYRNWVGGRQEKTEAGFDPQGRLPSVKEGSPMWAEEVVQRYGDVMPLEQQLEMMKFKALTGAGPQQAGAAPTPTGGGMPALTAEEKKAVLFPGIAKTGAADLDRMKLQLDQLGLQLKVMIEERAKEQGERGLGIRERGVATQEAQVGISERKLKAGTTKGILDRVQSAITRLQTDDSLTSMEKATNTSNFRVAAIRELSSTDPAEAKKYARMYADNFLQAAYAVAASKDYAGRPETQLLLTDLASKLSQMAWIVGIDSVNDAIIEARAALRNKKLTKEEEEYSSWLLKVKASLSRVPRRQ